MREILAAATALFPLSVLGADAPATGVSFSEPETVIAGPPSAIRLAVSPDGKHQLYGEPHGPDDGALEILERRLTDEGWSVPSDVAFNTEWNDFDPAFAGDGSGVYFFSDRPGGAGGDDLWFVPLEEDAWGTPVNLGSPINTAGDEWAPTPQGDGSLLFSSDGHGGLGGQDLYIARRTPDGWSEPRNLGSPVNSREHDYDAAFLDPGALLLTRSPDPENGARLFYACRTGSVYEEPRPAGPTLNLGGGWALGPSVSASEPGIVYFSALDPGAPNARIYRASYRIHCPRLEPQEPAARATGSTDGRPPARRDRISRSSAPRPAPAHVLRRSRPTAG